MSRFDGEMQAGGFTRRDVLRAFGAFATVALLGEVRAAAPARRMAATDWIAWQDEAARALAAGKMTPLAWMAEVERLAAEVDVAELMASVNRARITAAGRGATNDPAKRHVRFIDAATGEPRALAYGAALFDFEPANVITPHAHRHMASAHLVVDGRLRVRNYDRVRDDGDAIVIRPTRDAMFSVGAVSTMTSARDNVHWFVPHGGRATTFDVIISDLDAGEPSYEIRALDPLAATRLDDGSLRTPVIGFGEASKKYTASI
jgi:quercetin dioxygenase-like cupin family protein